MSGKYPFYSLSGRTDIEGEQMRPSVAESQTRKMIFECKKRREKNVFGQFGKNVCSRGKVFPVENENLGFLANKNEQKSTNITTHDAGRKCARFYS